MSINVGASKWNIARPDTEKVAILRNSLKISRLAAIPLVNRDHDTYEKAHDFLSAANAELLDPFLFDGMEEAADRLNRAVAENEKICVYGDYDVDGITSTALVCKYLQCRGFDNFIYYIPERLSEGYGMNISAVEKIASLGVNLIITVDNGVSAAAEIARAGELGVDVIVTDHHECRSEIPECVAVINPKRPGCGYPFMHLAGVGVAYKLVCAANVGLEPLPDSFLELVAIGTIADMMPLDGENRTLAAKGLAVMNTKPCAGVAAIMKSNASEKGKSSPKADSSFIGFVLAPRINAAGRIGDVGDAVALLTTEDEDEAAHLTDRLCTLNNKRQYIEGKIFGEACGIIESTHDFSRDKVIVAEHEGWNHGVVGIVSSRITEKYKLPSILISVEDGIGKGSARSVPGFNINGAISECRSLVTRFGGHELAAGLTLPSENIAEFKKAINDYARERISDDMLVKSFDIESELFQSDVYDRSVEELSMLEPCGCGNPVPLFAFTGAEISDITPIGQNKHLKLTLRKQERNFTALVFGTGPDDFYLERGDFADFAFSFDINNFAGRRTIQLIVRDIRPCEKIRNIVKEARSAFAKGVSGTECRMSAVPSIHIMREFYKFIKANEARFGTGINLWLFSRRFLNEYSQTRERSIGELPQEIYLYMFEIFRELGLAEYRIDDCATVSYSLCRGVGKVDIESSPLLNKLKACAYIQ